MNTPNTGQFRWVIFKEAKDWIGAALEFNIVVTGTDPRVVEAELNEAVLGYLESAKGLKGIRPHQINGILNQKADVEYENRWQTAQETGREAAKGNVPSPLSPDIYKAGIANLAV